MPGRFLSLFKPIGRILPEIKKPARKVSFNEKIFWTGLVLAIFLVMTEIPLFGIESGADNFGALRVIFASSRGTLMELGIGPIVTAGLILQLLAGSSIIKCDMSNSEDRGLFTSASKVFSIVLTAIQAGAYILSGMYGTSLAGPTIIVIFLQLISAGIIVLLMDELVQKGWGLGSGISLFIMAGVAQNIFWQTFSPPNGLFYGSLTTYLGGQQSLVDWVLGSSSGYFPSLIGFIATIGVFLLIIYLQGVRIELPMSYAGYKGFRSRYPIKLLYVSNLPIIFASALFANVYFFTQLLWSQFGKPAPGTNLFFQVFGDYNQSVVDGVVQGVNPVGGIAYFVTPPNNLLRVAMDPLRAAGYLGIVVLFCAIFSLIWLEVGGLGPTKVAKQLMDSGMQIPGYRRSGRPIEQILKRYIPVVTVLGGIIVGLVASVSDFLGVFGSGTGILLSVGIIYQYYELLMRERAAEMFPAFRRILGE
jgi:preprotein translocase SecY subunit